LTVSAEFLGALVVRFAIYAAVAFVAAVLLHARAPLAPVPVSFVVLLAGMAAVGAVRALTHKGRAPPA
jgi:hypothetical protein